MHLKSTPTFSTEDYLMPETATARTEERTEEINHTTRTASVSHSSTSTFTSSTNATMPRAESSKYSNNASGKGYFGAEVISGYVVGAVAGVVLIAVVLIMLYKMKRKKNNVRTARSNTQMSFDNLSYDGDTGQRTFEFGDMTDFEVLRSNIVNSIKRKTSAFSNSASKENEQGNSRKISCGRLSIVETLESTTADIGEIVQTIDV